MRSPEISTHKKLIKSVEYNHVNHKPGHGSIFHMGLMLIDGIGLGMIAVCTVFEGIEDYNDALYANSKENPETIVFFFCGIIMATLGLVFLIIHAMSFENMHDFEHIGMALLTVAPIVNMCAWKMFDSGLDPTHFFNRQWMATEIIEWCGMTILCISYIDADRYTVMFIELVGFFVLMVAAMFTVNIYQDRILPEFILRWDHIHIFDTCGLFMLCIVSVGHWHILGLAEEYNIKHPSARHHGGSNSSQKSPGLGGGLLLQDIEKGGCDSIRTRRNVDESSSSDSDSD